MQCSKFKKLTFLPQVAVLACAGLMAFPAAADLHSVTLATTAGIIVLELDDERAPVTVDNFLRYVDDGFYDNTIFHRVIEGFMVQGGGFTQSYERKETRPPIANEANNGLSNRRYSIAMARTNSPHSATAQFFINTVDNHNLDHTSATARGWGYTVFGSVIEGTDIIRQISEVPTGAGGPFSSDAPREAIVIIKASRNSVDQSATDDGAADEDALAPAMVDENDDPKPALGASDSDSAARSQTLESEKTSAPVIDEKLQQRTSLETD